MKNIKHPILVGFLLFILGLGGIFVLKALHFLLVIHLLSFKLLRHSFVPLSLQQEG
jgi:protein-S-isoprenylcysteine O-methyltransferase Ste14